jgi:hypothetical protein
MQSRGVTDLPYWPSQNMYVYKEVWVHPSIRWLAMMEDLLASPLATPGFTMTSTTAANGEITIRLTSRTTGAHRYALRTTNLRVVGGSRTVTVRDGQPATIEWKARRAAADSPWTAVAIEDGDVTRRRELFAQ